MKLLLCFTLSAIYRCSYVDSLNYSWPDWTIPVNEPIGMLEWNSAFFDDSADGFFSIFNEPKVKEIIEISSSEEEPLEESSQFLMQPRKVLSLEEFRHCDPQKTLWQYLMLSIDSIRFVSSSIVDFAILNRFHNIFRGKFIEIQFLSLDVDQAECLEFFKSIFGNSNIKLTLRNVSFKKRSTRESFLLALLSSSHSIVDIEFLGAELTFLVDILDSLPGALIEGKIYFDYDFDNQDYHVICRNFNFKRFDNLQKLLIIGKGKDRSTKISDKVSFNLSSSYQNALYSSLNLSLLDYFQLDGIGFFKKAHVIELYLYCFKHQWDFSLITERTTFNIIFKDLLGKVEFQRMANNVRHLKLINSRPLFSSIAKRNMRHFNNLISLNLKGLEMGDFSILHNQAWTESFSTLEHLDISDTKMQPHRLAEFFDRLLQLPFLKLKRFHIKNLEMSDESFSQYLAILDRCDDYEMLDLNEIMVDSGMLLAKKSELDFLCKKIACVMKES